MPDFISIYLVALNFSRSLFLQIGDVLYFAGPNSCDCKILVFLAGYQYYFYDFQEVPFN